MCCSSFRHLTLNMFFRNSLYENAGGSLYKTFKNRDISILDQGFSTRGNFVPKGTFGMSGDIFDYHDWGRGCTNFI